MPDLSQVEQTCLPTSTANLLIWFGHHGYPKLIPAGSSTDESNIKIVQRMMTDTRSGFDLGTRMDKIELGIMQYIAEAGYSSRVEYRGLGGGESNRFRQDWFRENDRPNQGFILVLAYCRFNPATNTIAPGFAAGHAMTLVNAEPDLLLVHDPAHQDDESGRKILTPVPLVNARWKDASGDQSADGLLLLSGSLLEAPPGTQPVLIGAISIAVYKDAKAAREAAGEEPRPGRLGTGASTDKSSCPPARSWWAFLTGVLFGK